MYIKNTFIYINYILLIKTCFSQQSEDGQILMAPLAIPIKAKRIKSINIHRKEVG